MPIIKSHQHISKANKTIFSKNIQITTAVIPLFFSFFCIFSSEIWKRMLNLECYVNVK